MTLSLWLRDKIEGARIDAIIDIRTIENIDISNLPTERVCGVYVIITKRIAYIGSSIDVFKRLRYNILDGNLCKKNLELIGCINVYITDNEHYARFLERILIEDIKPILNINKCPGSRTKIIGETTGIWQTETWSRYKKLKII